MITYCDKCGKCSRCGNCCAAMIPMTRKEEKRIRKYIEENNIVPEPFEYPDSINLQCCFYDRKNKLCKIYEVRPKICRSYKCNRNIIQLNKERNENHERAYWNNITNGMEKRITDMRLLFYNDPRTLIGVTIHAITHGTMECNEKQFECVKKYFRNCGQEELADSLEAHFGK